VGRSTVDGRRWTTGRGGARGWRGQRGAPRLGRGPAAEPVDGRERREADGWKKD
jgi:hypothetical protein